MTLGFWPGQPRGKIVVLFIRRLHGEEARGGGKERRGWSRGRWAVDRESSICRKDDELSFRQTELEAF